MWTSSIPPRSQTPMPTPGSRGRTTARPTPWVGSSGRSLGWRRSSTTTRRTPRSTSASRRTACRHCRDSARGPRPGPARSGCPSRSHAGGAPLDDGSKPFWRTRLTLTNTASATRFLRLKYVDVNLNTITSGLSGLTGGTVLHFEDVLEEELGILPGTGTYGHIEIDNVTNSDGTCCAQGWSDIDVQTEAYTISTSTGVGDYKTGMEGYSYLHGYSSFQSNLGTVQFDGAENSSAYRTNLILNEVTGSYCDVIIAAYQPGSFVPIATVTQRIPPMGYLSDELFRNILGLNLSEVTDVQIRSDHRSVPARIVRADRHGHTADSADGLPLGRALPQHPRPESLGGHGRSDQIGSSQRTCPDRSCRSPRSHSGFRRWATSRTSSSATSSA